MIEMKDKIRANQSTMSKTFALESGFPFFWDTLYICMLYDQLCGKNNPLLFMNKQKQNKKTTMDSQRVIPNGVIK